MPFVCSPRFCTRWWGAMQLSIMIYMLLSYKNLADSPPILRSWCPNLISTKPCPESRDGTISWMLWKENRIFSAIWGCAVNGQRPVSEIRCSCMYTQVWDRKKMKQGYWILLLTVFLLFSFSHHGFVTTWQGSCNFANCTFAHGEHELRGVSRGSTNKFDFHCRHCLSWQFICMNPGRLSSDKDFSVEVFFLGGSRFFHEKMPKPLVPKLHEWIHRKQMTSIPTQPPNLTQEKGRESWTKMQAYQCKPIEVIWKDITFEAGLLERNGFRPQAKYRQCWLASHRWSVFVFSYFSLFSHLSIFSILFRYSPKITNFQQGWKLMKFSSNKFTMTCQDRAGKIDLRIMASDRFCFFMRRPRWKLQLSPKRTRCRWKSLGAWRKYDVQTKNLSANMQIKILDGE